MTPPFAGYVSGHSTYSRAAAEVLTLLTGDPFFPGGMGEFRIPANDYLVFERGPSVDIVLQWANYRGRCRPVQPVAHLGRDPSAGR